MRALVVFFVACSLALAQGPVYDVASIKPSQGGKPSGARSGPGGRLTATNTTLKTLMVFAWDVHSYEIAGGPPWLERDNFEIVAKAAPGTPPATLKLMLQQLLAESAVHQHEQDPGGVTVLVWRGRPRWWMSS